MRQILLSVVFVLSGAAQVNAQQMDCKTAVGFLIGMAVAGAPEDVVKGTIKEGLNGRVSEAKEQEIYLKTMRYIYSIYGSELMSQSMSTNITGVDNGIDILEMGETIENVVCVIRRVWPNE
jgi:hypothetical protein|tara:strand:- start:552 stop:914 length:363 start_codon:yes stop_codon:yes gene_type:complete